MRQSRKKQYAKTHEVQVPKYEAWDLFYYQARYIAAGLRDFIHMKRNGVPSDLEKDISEQDKDLKRDDVLENASEVWEKYLREMFFAFDQIGHEHPGSPYNQWWNKAYDKWSKTGKPLFKETIKHPDGSVTCKGSNVEETPDEVIQAEKEYQARIQNGLNLYAAYFMDLWD